MEAVAAESEFAHALDLLLQLLAAHEIAFRLPLHPHSESQPLLELCDSAFGGSGVQEGATCEGVSVQREVDLQGLPQEGEVGPVLPLEDPLSRDVVVNVQPLVLGSVLPG